jgi:hypothetical protein
VTDKHKKWPRAERWHVHLANWLIQGCQVKSESKQFARHQLCHASVSETTKQGVYHTIQIRFRKTGDLLL